MKEVLALIAFCKSFKDEWINASKVLNLSVSCKRTVVNECCCPMSSRISKSWLICDLSILCGTIARVESHTRHTIWSEVSPLPPPPVLGWTSTIVLTTVVVSLVCQNTIKNKYTIYASCEQLPIGIRYIQGANKWTGRDGSDTIKDN